MPEEDRAGGSAAVSEAAVGRMSGALAEKRQLAQVAAQRVDRKDLAVLRAIGVVRWIDRGAEVHAPVAGAVERERQHGVHPAEVGQLEDVGTVGDDHFTNRAVGERVLWLALQSAY